jgi:DNA-binding CsgD family transcriptional regulator
MTMVESHRAMVIGEPVPSLVRWGRSPDADLLYRALVTLGPATRRDLCRELGSTARRVRQAIDELIWIGAIASRPRPGSADATWSARPPAEVVAALHRARLRPGVRHAVPLRDRQAAIQAAAVAVLPVPLALGDGLRHLVTRELTRDRLSELSAVSRREHLAMNPEEVFDRGSAQAAAPVDRRLLSRGVQMRVLGVQPPDPDPLAPFGRAPADPRAGYRQALAVPMKLFLIDRKVALFPVDPHNFERGYLEVSQPPVVSALVALFERHWAGAKDPREDAMPEVVLTPRERALISLLAQGHTDVTAARELGVSPRSVSTIVRDLMDRFQVHNRFQLGLALGALRAVPAVPPPGKEHDEQT